MTPQTNRSGGFTLVELMLAMTFLATMLMLATAVFMQLLTVYNKGVAVKQMNQVGRVMTDDFLRVSNSAADLYVQEAGVVRCMQVGSNVYVWGYYDDSTSTPGVYVDTSGNLVPFSRLVSSIQSCPDSTTLNTTDYKPILSSSVRVYGASIKKLENSLVRVKFTFGTYLGNESIDPVVDAVTRTVSCPSTSFGSYCATGTYETVLFVAN